MIKTIPFKDWSYSNKIEFQARIQSIQELIDLLMISENVFISGGFAISCFSPRRNYSDVDFYFSSKEEYELAKEKVLSKYAYSATESHNITSFQIGDFLKEKIQMIGFSFGNPEQVFKSFDFYNSMIGIYLKNGEWNVVFDDKTIISYQDYRGDIQISLDQKLSLNENVAVPNAKLTAPRINKYLTDKGFYIDSTDQSQLNLIANVLQSALKAREKTFSDYYGYSKYVEILASFAHSLYDSILQNLSEFKKAMYYIGPEKEDKDYQDYQDKIQ